MCNDNEVGTYCILLIIHKNLWVKTSTREIIFGGKRRHNTMSLDLTDVKVGTCVLRAFLRRHKCRCMKSPMIWFSGSLGATGSNAGSESQCIGPERVETWPSSREYRAVHRLLTTVPYWQPGLTVTVRIVRSGRALWLVANSWRDASTAGVRTALPVSVLTLLWLTADSLPALLPLLFLLRDMVLFAQQRYVALLPILCSANTDCVVCRV